jgi:methylmalonyl-CoA/ethylmalonyl-CoA epimerase
MHFPSEHPARLPLAGLPPGTVRGLDHVGIVVRNMAAAVATFTTLLGLQLVHDETLPHLHVHLSYLQTGGQAGAGTFVQLVEPTGPGPVMEFLDSHGEGLHHVCFAVEDVEAAVVVTGGTPAAVFPGGRGRRCAFLTQQPDGVLVELTETTASFWNRKLCGSGLRSSPLAGAIAEGYHRHGVVAVGDVAGAGAGVGSDGTGIVTRRHRGWGAAAAGVVGAVAGGAVDH